MVLRSTTPVRGERRRGLTFVLVVAAVIYLAVTFLATVWTDLLWFDTVGFGSVWRLNFFVTLVLGLVGSLVVFGVILGNLVLADRLSPRLALLDLGDDQEVVERFREWVEPRLRLVRLGVAAGFAVLIGVGTVAWRDDILLFLNPTSFGATDPIFDNDIAFYIFRLPMWENLTTWLFNVAILTLLLAAGLHYLNGGIRVRPGEGIAMRQGVKVHLSVLVAVVALLRAATYRIDAYQLLTSTDGSFVGAGYTDVNARLPAIQLLIVVSVLAAIAVVWNIRRRGWTLAIVAVASWVLVAVAANLIYPAVVERFQVSPNPLEREREFLGYNIQATQAAFGIDSVEVRPFSAAPDLDADGIEENRLTIDNLRLWDPDVLTRTYQNLQEIRPYYRADKVDTDRYIIDGEPTQVNLAVRELEEPNIPEQDWQNQRLIYTHGMGTVLSAANAVESDGQPQFLIQDVPPVAMNESLQYAVNDLDQSRIYFGETYDPAKPVIVRTGALPQEVDLPLETGTSFNEYAGAAGVELDNIIRRLAFGLRYRDLNMLISSQLRDDSRILVQRSIEDRVTAVAPFLALDADPYPVLTSDGTTWMLDMYTITDSYPYAEQASFEQTDRLQRRSGLPRAGFNYIRNSVKAAVDAYDGTVTLYVADPEDPIIQSWQKIYPDLFTPMEEMPAELTEHLRYPQDMFVVQSEMYLEYHVGDTDVFFRGSDAWGFPTDPSDPNRSLAIGNLLWGDRVAIDGGNAVTPQTEFLPHYLLLRLPGEDDVSYSLVQPFTPLNKRNMSALLMADSTPGRYGRLIDYRLPTGSLVEGTGQVGDRINQDPVIAGQITLWSQQGSDVIFGDMLVVPVEESLLYVMPVYLSAQANGGFPEFRRVVVAFGNQIEWADSLDSALALVFGEGVGPVPDVPPPTTGVGEVDELLRSAQERFDEARDALRQGNLAEYQRLVEEAENLVDEALGLLVPPTDAARGVRAS